MTKFPNPTCYQHNPSFELLCARRAEGVPNHDHDTVTDLVPLRLGNHIVLWQGPTRTADKKIYEVLGHFET